MAVYEDGRRHVRSLVLLEGATFVVIVITHCNHLFNLLKTFEGPQLLLPLSHWHGPRLALRRRCRPALPFLLLFFI